MYISSDDSPFFSTLGFGFSSPSITQCVAPRRIAVPHPGHFPGFDDILNVALVGAQLGQTVAVLCLTEQILHTWQSRLNAQTIPVPSLDLLDAYAACPNEWHSFFAKHPYDMIILHGIRVALEVGRLSLTTAQDLVNAIPAGLIVFA
jgi:hypothetical protein